VPFTHAFAPDSFRDKATVKNLVSGVTRLRRRLDYVLSTLTKRNMTSAVEPGVRQVRVPCICLFPFACMLMTVVMLRPQTFARRNNTFKIQCVDSCMITVRKKTCIVRKKFFVSSPPTTMHTHTHTRILTFTHTVAPNMLHPCENLQVLRLALYELQYEGLALHALGEHVELARGISGQTSFAPAFVNGVLREAGRRAESKSLPSPKVRVCARSRTSEAG